MPDLLQRGVVRLFRHDGSPEGKTLGVAWIAHRDGLLVTCAHVLEKEDGVLDGSRSIPLVFHCSGGVSSARILPGCWRPSDREDVAVLQLEEPAAIAEITKADSGATESVLPVALPMGYSTHLRDSRAASSHGLRTFGFPRAKPIEGLAGLEDVVGVNQESGFEVVTVRSNEVSYGFSGSPVWDDELGAVVGVNVSIVKPGADLGGKQSETAFFIPIETIRKVCDRLGLPTGDPYRSLDVFEEKHSDWYFGREVASAQLSHLLAFNDIVTVVGVSGSGKSSLVAAGLVKGLAAAKSPLLERPRIRFRIGPNPMLALVTAIEGQAPDGSGKVAEVFGLSLPGERARHETEEQLNQKPVEQLAASLRAFGKGCPLILICDQFERLYTECPDDLSRSRFTAVLLASACRDIKILIAIRADYYGRVLDQEALGRTVGKAQVTLLPMTIAELGMAVECPARLLFRYFQNRVVDDMVRDVSERAGDLPLLQFALTELWARDNLKGVLTEDTYRSLGAVDDKGDVVTPGVRGVIVRRANGYYQDLPDDAERDRCRQLFRLLIATPSNVGAGPAVSRRVLSGELDSPTLALANQLADTFLLTASEDPLTRQRTFEVAHEALIRSWPLLLDWEQEKRAWAVWYQVILFPSFNQWLARNRSKDLYLRAKAVLADAQLWIEQEPTGSDGQIHQYVRASLKANWWRVKRLQALGVALALLLVGITVWALVSRQTAIEQTAKLQLQTTKLQEETTRANTEQQTAEGNAQKAAAAADKARLAAAEAQRQARDSFSQRLAVQAQSSLNSLPERSTLVATQAIKLLTESGDSPGAFIEQALRDTLSTISGKGLYGHRKTVHAAAFSADGQFLITGSEDETARIWKITSTEKPSVAHILKGQDQIDFVALGHLNRWAVTLTGNHVGCLWDTTSPGLYLRPTLTLGAPGSISAMAISHDHRRLATGGVAGDIILWDLSALNPLTTPLRLPHVAHQAITALAFSADDSKLASGTSSGTIQLWNLAVPEGPPIRELDANFKPKAGNFPVTPDVTSLALSKDTHWLVAASNKYTDSSDNGDLSARLWDLTKTGLKNSPILLTHTEVIDDTVFDPLGRWVLTASNDGISLWNLSQPVARFTPRKLSNDRLKSIGISLDGGKVFAGGEDGVLRLWDTSGDDLAPGPILLKGGEQPIERVVISDSGNQVASVGFRGAVREWNHFGATQPSVLQEDLFGLIYEVDYRPELSADRRCLLTRTRNGLQVWALDNLSRGPKFSLLTKGIIGFRRTAISPNGRWLLVDNESGETALRLFDLNKANAEAVPRILTGSLDPHSNESHFSHGSRWLSVDSDNGAPRKILDLNEPDPIASGKILVGATGSLQFSNDDRWVACVVEPAPGAPAVAMLWDLRGDSQAVQGVSLSGQSGDLVQVEFSPDSRWLVSWASDFSNAQAAQDETLDLWDLTAPAGPLRRQLKGHKYAVSLAKFSPDSQWLLTASSSPDSKGDAILWGLREQNPESRRLALGGLDGAIVEKSFSFDSSWVVTVQSEPVRAQIWKIDRAGQGLTPIEMQGPKPTVNPHLWNIEFDPHSRWLALACQDDPTPYLFDFSLPRSGAIVVGNGLPSGDRAPKRLTFSGDGNWLASLNTDEGTGQDGSEIRLWKLDRSENSLTPEVLDKSKAYAEDLTFSPDNQNVVTMDAGGARAFVVELDSALSAAQLAVGRNLSWHEWTAVNFEKPYEKTFVALPVDETVIEALVEGARGLVAQGDLASAHKVFSRAVDWAVETNDADLCNTVCRDGSLLGLANEALRAGEHAVELLPWDPNFCEWRGLARALVGDFAGATSDIQSFVEHESQSGGNKEMIAMHRRWISALNENRSPFDADTVQKLRDYVQHPPPPDESNSGDQ